MVGGVEQRLAVCRVGLAAVSVIQRGCSQPGLGRAIEQRCGKRAQAMFIAQVQAAGIASAGFAIDAVQIARQRNFLVRCPQRRNGAGHLNWIGNQRIDIYAVVADLIDKRGIGAVFQQASHQIGQQCFVCANRRINAAGAIQLFAADHFGIQRFAHAMQTLEFVLARIVIVSCQVINGSQRLRIVRGKLRVYGVGRRQQFACARQIGNIGVDLARIHWIAFQAVQLRAFDFGIPVGALDQADHQAMAGAAAKINDVINDMRRAFLIGLDHKADAVPAFEFTGRAKRFQQIQGELKPIGFFGVDVQTHIVGAGQAR